MGTPVWSHDGIICTGESYKSVVKLTFAKGASLKDPARLFNSSLDGNVRRAIDIHEGEDVDAVRVQGARSPGGRAQQFGKSKRRRKRSPRASRESRHEQTVIVLHSGNAGVRLACRRADPS